jgi:hypothetical protein
MEKEQEFSQQYFELNIRHLNYFCNHRISCKELSEVQFYRSVIYSNKILKNQWSVNCRKYNFGILLSFTSDL